MKLVFIGPQGSGKGTQAHILSKKLGIPHISTGDLCRNAKGELGEQIKKTINTGALISDDLLIELLKQRLQESDVKNGFILDGTPRNMNQVNLLKPITNFDKIIEITLSDETAIKRISGRVSCEKCKEGYNTITEPKPKQPGICDKCGGKLIKREDDTEQAVKKRLETYHQETEPIIEYYKKQEKLIKINGEQLIVEQSKELFEKLGID